MWTLLGSSRRWPKRSAKESRLQGKAGSRGQLGNLMALDRLFDFLRGEFLGILHAHFHLAALGWVTMMIFGVSYQLIPMFTLSTLQNRRIANLQFWLLNVGTVGLFWSLFTSSRALPAFVLMVIAVIYLFAYQLYRIIERRRRPDLDWGVRYFMTAFGYLLLLTPLGLLFSFSLLSEAAFASRLAFAYGFLGLIGWVSQTIIGMLYKIVPFLVWYRCYSDKVGLEPVPSLGELCSQRLERYGYWLLNVGILGMAAGLVTGTARLIQAFGAILTLGVFIFAENILLALGRLLPRSSLRVLGRFLKRASAISLVLLALPGTSSAGSVRELGRLDEHWRIMGSIRGRYEVWNFFDPGAVPNGNNDYGFFALKARLGLQYQSRGLEAFLEGQWTHLFGLPDDANAPRPFGDLGLGATFFAHHNKQNQGRVFLKQAYLRVKDLPLSGFSAKAGRFEYSDGLEVLTGDPTLDWVKRARIGERLIGPFGWAHAGRSFDGFQVAYDVTPFNVTTLVARPTQGGFEVDGGDEISGIDLVGATITVKRSALLPGMEERLFYFFYQDRRDVPNVSNQPLPRLNQDGLYLSTIGGHLLGGYPLVPGQMDLLAWGAYQFGAWGPLDQDAFAFAIEGGYQFPKIPWKPWLRAGYFQSSGDSDQDDGRHETFFQLLPTVRIYAQFPFFNPMNLQDAFVQLLLKPHQKLSVRSDFHWLWLSETSDLWYVGSGATRKNRINGFAGRPSGGDRGLAQLLDLSIGYKATSHVSVNFYYAHAFGGSVVSNIFQGTSADFAYLELEVSF